MPLCAPSGKKSCKRLMEECNETKLLIMSQAVSYLTLYDTNSDKKCLQHYGNLELSTSNRHIDQQLGCGQGTDLQQVSCRVLFGLSVTVIIEWLGSGRTWECFRHHHFLPIHHTQPGGTRPQMPCKIIIPMQLARQQPSFNNTADQK